MTTIAVIGVGVVAEMATSRTFGAAENADERADTVPRPSSRRTAVVSIVATTSLPAAMAMAAGRPALGAVTLATGLGAIQAVCLRPDLTRRATTSAIAASHAVMTAAARAACWGIGAVTFGLLVLPGWLLGLVLGAPPLGTTRRREGTRWLARSPTAHGLERRAHGVAAIEPPPGVGRERTATPGAGRRPRLRPALVASSVAALVVLDVLAGATLTGTGVLPPPDRGELVTQKQEAAAATMAMPNIADEPWAEEFGRELADYQLQAPTYVPYLVSAPHPYRGRHLNVTGGERRSYRPARATASRPLQVGFFGGSTTFGIGQRDTHTIPSEVARIAESEGIALEVHNHGFPAWVSWQEMTSFERLLAAGERYDLVVFYDGFNEFAVQRTEYDRDPTHFGAGSLQAIATRYHEDHETDPGYLGGPRELLESYHRTSGLWRTFDRLLAREPTPSWQASPSGADDGRQRAAALSIYERSLDLIRPTARRHGVPVRFFWQPTSTGWPPAVRAALPDDVIDISGALDGHQDDVYISEVHTNEAGARMVAEAMWAELAPTLTGMAAQPPPP